MGAEARPFEVRAPGGNVLRGECAGSGPVVLQAHGITAARSYVTHGSHLLERKGFTSAMYDARGHGESDPAPDGEEYTYAALAKDMAAVAAEVGGGERVVLAGHSMGAHTAARFALDEPDAVAGLVAIGPASLGKPVSEGTKVYWDRLADGLEQGGVDGFVEAYDDGSHDPQWRDVVLRLARRRLELHRSTDAVAEALREVTASLPFEGSDALGTLEVPVLVVASHDEADPGHPWDVAVEWTERIPNARMVSEDDGESPLAWQGGKLSREIAAFCEEPAVAERLG
ncbi:MAG TPA: alpha/beta fold hydrolase [Solirubrobacterales bacterium]|nr:alpha/beta fold hydrolase [Solirubrobacterales bacterium]